ncbi:MAG: hypothetical protein HFI66_11985 [Lachnospiraceae bacterium]|jgi:phage minor structural protein|nr:hypothetical protein [Lachnospiraceae bacterium]
MLQLINGVENPILNVDDFYITEKWSGLDELVFTISIHDPAYPAILEEVLVQYEQPYLVKAIDAGAETAKVKCQIDLDAWKAGMLLGYTNGSNTAHATISGVMPTGWQVNDHSGSVRRRTIEGEAYTPLEVVEACPDIYGIVVRFDVKNKIIHLYDPDQFKPLGAFASRELNLTEINYKGKSSDFATRLYAVGKDGVTFAGINGGKAYVEDHTYSDKLVSAYWKDERYTDPQSLLDDAQKALKEMAVPVRSYSCNVVDLAATNPELYSFQDFSLFSVVRLIDDIKGVSLNHQVVEYKRYPYHPEKNVVTLSTVAPSITSTVKGIKAQIEKPTSGFRQQIQNLIDSMASTIAGYDGGNMVITQNAEGKPNGIMIMDTDSKATAKKVLWLNLMGITYSHNGADGPWDTVWSFEQGGFIADWLVAGVIQGIKIIAEQGVIAGWDINQRSMYKDVVAADGTIYRVYLQPPLASNPNKTWILSCQKSTDGGKTFLGNFVLYSDGSARFGNTFIGADGTVKLGEHTYLYADGSAKFGDSMIYSNGAARFGSEAGLNVRCYKDGLELYANGKMVAALDAATDGNGQMKSMLRVNRILTGKCSEVSSWN